MNNKPPFQITNNILELLQNISHELGVLLGAKLYCPPVKLRKNNRIKTIHSSLAIEGNTLSIKQITDLINGKRVLAPEKDIIEVNNAIKLYNNLNILNPLSIESLLETHKLLMQGLITDNGRWRNSGAAIFKGKEIQLDSKSFRQDEFKEEPAQRTRVREHRRMPKNSLVSSFLNDAVAHLAPPANRVDSLMEDLFYFINHNSDIPEVIKACVFHYELEFIHPFSDGNGRMGRLWQQLLLIKTNAIFEYISVESLVRNNQSEYYNTLNKCDKLGESTLFIEFMMTQILEALKLYTNDATPNANTASSRIEIAKINLSNKWFSRKDYILIHKDMSTATASRDLSFGIEQGILICRGIKNQTYYKFKEKEL
ncbi:MAG: palindromic element RPE3 domain-containing protein [Rickettsia endosymbiont of Oxypoda opaca]|nr:palindromic element RPE3 domain-containing protein [Rickettsia endosymbiont of Oxypoda opaca]